MSISLEWQQALTVIGRAGCSLSFFGSAWICQHVLSSPLKRTRVYHRLLFGMSLGELIESIFRFLMQWSVPAEEYGWWGARGTRFTCILQGFMIQLCLVSSFYNAGLSLYCLFTVRYRWTEEKSKKYLEPWIHAVSWIVCLGQATAGLHLKLYNSLGFICYVAPWPPMCEQSYKSPNGQGTCERGDNAFLYLMFFYQFWHWLSFLCTAVSMLFVYWTLLVQEKRNRRYVFAEHASSNDSPKFLRRLSYIFSSQMRQQQQHHQQQHGSPETQNNTPRRDNGVAARRPKHSKMFAWQATLYVMIFYFSHIFASIWTIHNTISGGSLFWVIVMSAFTLPIEGWLNFLVYIRPRYLRLRREHGDLGALQILREVLGRESTAITATRRPNNPEQVPVPDNRLSGELSGTACPNNMSRDQTNRSSHDDHHDEKRGDGGCSGSQDAQEGNSNDHDTQEGSQSRDNDEEIDTASEPSFDSIGRSLDEY